MKSFSQNMQGDAERENEHKLKETVHSRIQKYLTFTYLFIYLHFWCELPRFRDYQLWVCLCPNTQQQRDLTSFSHDGWQTLLFKRRGSSLPTGLTRDQPSERNAHRLSDKNLVVATGWDVNVISVPLSLVKAELLQDYTHVLFPFESPVLSLAVDFATTDTDHCLKKVNPDEVVLKKKFDLRKSALQACWLVLTAFSDPVLAASLRALRRFSPSLPFSSLSCSVGRLSSQGNPQWRD